MHDDRWDLKPEPMLIKDGDNIFEYDLSYSKISEIWTHKNSWRRTHGRAINSTLITNCERSLRAEAQITARF